MTMKRMRIDHRSDGLNITSFTTLALKHESAMRADVIFSGKS